MIKEETLTVTIMKYTAIDGTEYVAEGPSLGQANYAKSMCEHRNQMYDFLHFSIDENKLKKYNKANWLHFKWLFLGDYIRDAYWANGTMYSEIKNFSWMNGLDKESFEEIVINSYYDVGYEKGTVVPRGLWKNTDFVTIMVESGILKKKQLSEKYPSEKYNNGGRSILLTHLLNCKNWTSIKKYINKGYYNITAADIHEKLNSFFETFYLTFEKEEKMGTKNILVYNGGYNKNDNDIFKYYIPKEDRDFLKYLFTKCVSSKEEILYAILSNREYFLSSIYGGVVVFSEHFYGLSRKDAEQEAEKLYGYYLWATNGKYEKTSNYGFNDDLLKTITTHPLLHIDQYRLSQTEEIYKDFLPHFKGKETELEVYFYWATNGSVKWAKIHGILSKLDLKQGICWNYSYQELIDLTSNTITKLNENKEKLEEIELLRKKLNKEEMELLKQTI